MFTVRRFHIPRELSVAYCRLAVQALALSIPTTQVGIIHLIAVDEVTMTDLNSTYRGKEGPTDILTFSYYHPNLKKGDIAGEIYLYLPKIHTYAHERGVSYLEQLRMTCIHGLVHLMGHDHEKTAEARQMAKIEKIVQDTIGELSGV